MKNPRFVTAVMAAALLCGPLAPADESSERQTLARLEALITARQARLDDLNRQVAAARQDSEAARTAALRQQIREVLGDSDFRESLMPSTAQTGYDKGFFIKSSDEKFLMKVGGRVQFRWTHYNTGDRNRYLNPRQRRNDRTGFDLPRVYLSFAGHAYTQDLTYAFILDGSEYRNYSYGVLHAEVNYRFIDEFQFRAGIMRISGTRANFHTGTMQFCELPIVQEMYTVNRGLGVRFWGQLFKDRPVHGEYNLDVINSLNSPSPRTITTDDQLYAQGHDNNPALCFRTCWVLFGGDCDYPGEALPFTAASSDLGWHTVPFVTAGFHYLYTEDDHDGTTKIAVAQQSPWVPGGFANVTSDGLQIHQWGLDGTVQYRGFSATAEYVLRMLDVRRTHGPLPASVFLATGDGDTSTQHMAYLQCGYLLPIPGWERKFEIVGRVGTMHINTGGSETTWEYSGGLNYYIKGHQVKLQADVTRITEAPFAFSAASLANVNGDALIYRLQLQVAF